MTWQKMQPSTKKILGDFFVRLIIWLATFFIVQWLVDGGFWLHFFLASGMNASSLYGKITELKKDLDELDFKFSIADQELVRVSNLLINRKKGSTI